MWKRLFPPVEGLKGPPAGALVSVDNVPPDALETLVKVHTDYR